MKRHRLAWAAWAALVASCPFVLPAAEAPGPKRTVVIVLERFPAYSWTLPNGETLSLGGSIGTTVDADDPNAVEVAKRHHEEMKQLIAEKKGYKLRRAFGQEKYGGKRYEYWFTYADGSRSLQDFEIPLTKVTSWDDYLQKRQAEEVRRYQLINRAITAGRYRLKHVEVHYSFTCRDAGTFHKYTVRFVPLADGRQIARISPLEPDSGEPAARPGETNVVETSWQEHLDAVRSGKREVMSQDVTKTYFYEVDLEDGSRTYLPCSKPLK